MRRSCVRATARCNNRGMPPSEESKPGYNSDWLVPPDEQQGLRRYVTTLRERIWLIVAVTALTTIVFDRVCRRLDEDLRGGSDAPGHPGIRSGSRGPRADQRFLGSDARRLHRIPTCHDHLRSPSGSRRSSARAGTRPRSSVRSPQNRLRRATSSPSPPRVPILTRQQRWRTHLPRRRSRTAPSSCIGRSKRELPGLEKAQEQNPTLASAAQVAAYQQLLAGSDPTIRVETEAEVPTTPVSPRPVLSVAAGILAGLILGITAAFAFQVLDPRLRREEQLRTMFRVPIIGRVPKEPHGSSDKALSPRNLSPATAEAYRTLRGTVSASSRAGTGNVLLVTGSSPSEGKTSTAINLAASLSATGRRVILIEADLRRPAIGRSLGIAPHRGVVGVADREHDAG